MERKTKIIIYTASGTVVALGMVAIKVLGMFINEAVAVFIGG